MAKRTQSVSGESGRTFLPQHLLPSVESQEGPACSSICCRLWRVRKDLAAPASPAVSGKSGRTCQPQHLLPFKLWLDSGCSSLLVVLQLKSKDAKEASLRESTVAGETDSLLCLHSEIISYLDFIVMGIIRGYDICCLVGVMALLLSHVSHLQGCPTFSIKCITALSCSSVLSVAILKLRLCRTLLRTSSCRG